MSLMWNIRLHDQYQARIVWPRAEHRLELVIIGAPFFHTVHWIDSLGPSGGTYPCLGPRCKFHHCRRWEQYYYPALQQVPRDKQIPDTRHPEETQEQRGLWIPLKERAEQLRDQGKIEPAQEEQSQPIWVCEQVIFAIGDNQRGQLANVDPVELAIRVTKKSAVHVECLKYVTALAKMNEEVIDVRRVMESRWQLTGLGETERKPDVPGKLWRQA